MTKFKTFFIYFFGIVVFVAIGWLGNTAFHLYKTSHLLGVMIPKPTPLAKYSIDSLSKADIKPSKITLGRVLKDDPKFTPTGSGFTSYEFSMQFSPDFSDNLKTTSGLINIPKGDGPFPVIVMFRGYVDPSVYFIGDGTTHSAEFFAQNGFITIAPDFLGYGDSDHEASDIFESRFQTYTLAMSLLKSLDHSLAQSFAYSQIFIWGHSNGGQITLTTLEATGVNYPTVLWAPVSKPFPYSILYYTDDASDSGKFLRNQTANFENNYNSDDYSLTNYLGNIKAPIQLNQGTADEAVPVAWSDLLNKNLKAANVDVTYIKYPGADHNLTPGWNLAVTNALTFFRKYLQ